MRKLKLFFACLLMAVLSIGQMWGAESSVTISPSQALNDGGVSPISIACAKGDGSSNPAISSGQLRLYQAASGKTTGNTITFSSTATITKIEFDFVSGKTASNGSFSAGSYDDATTTWTGSATSLTLTVTGTTSGTRIYINSMKVYFDGGTPSPDPDPEPDPEPQTGDNYELVTNVANLAEGDKIIIVNADATKAISTTQNNNNRGAADVTTTNDVITPGDAVQVLTLGITNEHWTLYTGAGYLYAASNSSNYMKTQTTNNANGEWTISIANDGTATIVAQGSYTRNTMQYNSGSTIFSCYGSASQTALKIFKKVDGTVKPSAELSYAAADQKKLTKLGETFTAPTLVNPHGVAVTYASSAESVAEVAANGAVTIKAAGVAVITASFAGNDDYKAGDASYTIGVTSHAGTQDDNYTVADAKIAIDAIDSKEGVYVSGIVNEANLDQANIDQYHNATYWISDDGSAKEFEVFRGKYIANADVTSVEDIKVGDEVVVYGNITKFNNTYEFAEGNYLISLDRNKAAAGLSYTVLEIEKNIGDVAFTNELTNPNNLTVTYSSSNASVASVDAASGLVTINAMGTAVITASFGGNASYLEGEATYTLIVNDPSLTKVTFDASNENDKTSSDDEWTLTKGDITLSISEGRLNTAEYRLYKDKVLTLASSNGNIKRVELECTASGDTKYGPGSITAQEGYSYNGTIGVWVGDAASVELTAGNNQTRMSKINVYYIPDTRTAAGLAWDPADDIEITVGETFTAPTLLNPNSIDAAEITIESSNTSLATVTAGVVALVADATGEATITATFAGNDDYKPATVSYNITVNAAAPTPLTDYYEKVTSGDVEEGTYLIVYEDASVAFDGGLETLDAENNTIDVEITNDNKIGVTQATAAATFYIDPTAGSIQAANGKYIGVGGNSNGLKTSDNADTYTHDFSIDGDGNAVIAPNFEGSTMSLRYNAASNQARFRYYKDNGQQPIALYKLANEAIKPAAGLAWDPSDDIELTVGDAFTAPTLLNPNNIDAAEITIESSNTNVATVTAGVVALVEDVTGTTTITATFAGNASYKPATVSYKIKVNPAHSIYVSPSLTVNFGSVAKDASVDDKVITVTLTEVPNATATLGGDNPEVFSIDPASPAALTASGDITISASSATAGVFEAKLTISDDASLATSRVVTLKLTVTDPAAEETPISTTSKWVAATAADLVDGAEVIITGVKDEVVYAMGEQKSTNRAAYVASVDGEGVLTPGEGTMSFTLVAQAAEGVFALRTSDGKYLYAASNGSNHLKTQDVVNDSARWTLTATSAIAVKTGLRNVMQFNGGNTKLFSCYSSDSQEDIQFYVPKPVTPPTPVYTEVRSGLEAGRHYTVCLEKNVTAVKGATFWSLTYRNEGGTAAYLVEETAPFPAGKPYIFQATGDNDGKLEVVYGSDEVNEPVENGALRGTFGGLTTEQLNAINVGDAKVYMIFSNELCPIGTDNHLDAHRAYVRYDLLTVPSTSNFAPGKRVKSMPMQGQTTTGIDALNASETPVKMIIDGQLFIIRGEKMYNVNGQLVK